MISTDEQNSLVDVHNQWRTRFNSPPVVWDGNLAAVAQDWANQIAASGQFGHRPNNQFGENIFMGTSGAFPANTVVDDWGSEVANWDMPSLSCAPDKVCGHFTQVVWSTTTKVGCGKATGPDGNDYWVCNYDPAGNMQGQSPFAAGTTPPAGNAVPAPTADPTPPATAPATDPAAPAPTPDQPIAAAPGNGADTPPGDTAGDQQFDPFTL